MRAVVVEEHGVVPRLQQVPDPECADDGVVVRVEATGLCRSDWHGWAGHDAGIVLPHVPGHELAGTVVALGAAVERWEVGARVTTPFVLACGRCAACGRGDGQVCTDQRQPGFTEWGSYADLVALPRADTNLVRLPDGLDAVVAAGLGCRVATAYRAVALVGRVQPGEVVAVHGCGGVGLAAVQVAGWLGASVVALDPSPVSRDLAASLGAGTVLDPADVAGLRDLDVSIDAFGSRATLAASIACLRPRGRHVQVGLLGGADAVPPVDVGRVVSEELQLLGCHGLAASDYPALLDAMVSGALHPELLLRDRIGLDEAGERLAALGEPGAGVGGVTVIVP